MNYSVQTVHGTWVDVSRENIEAAARSAGITMHGGATDEVAERAQHYYKNALKSVKHATGATPETEDDFKALLSMYFFDGDRAKGGTLWEFMESAIGMAALKVLDCWED